MKKFVAAGALALAAVLAVSGCTPPKPAATTAAVKTGGAVSVMWNQAFYSANPGTSVTNNVTNSNVWYLTHGKLWYYDKDYKMVKDPSFATYEKVSDNPLTVKVKIADTATWSDGTPVTAIDAVFDWAASSGAFNTVSADDAEKTRDKDSDKLGDLKGVYFDTSSAAMALVKDMPEISSDDKTITYKFSKPFADWEYNLMGPGLPVHILAKKTLGMGDAKEAKKAVLEALKAKDADKLSKLATGWNNLWNFDDMPTDTDLLVGNGPFKITALSKSGQYLTVSRNDNYKGGLKPKLDTITIRYAKDPNAAVQALQNNEVSIIAPQSTPEILEAVKALPNVAMETKVEASYEHIDLTMDAPNGPFNPETYGGDAEKARKVRDAFLKTIPRQDIVEKLVKPLNPQAEVRGTYNVMPGSANYADVAAKNGMKEKYAAVDIEGAKKLLAEVGVANPQVRLMYAESNTRRVQEARLIKESAEKAGFKIVDQPNPKWSSELGKKTYDAVFFAWSSNTYAVTESDANYRSDGENSKKGQNNFTGYKNAEMNKVLDSLQTEVDPAKQKEILIKVEQLLVNDAYGLPIFQFPGIVAWNKKVQNVSSMQFNPGYYWNAWEWSLS